MGLLCMVSSEVAVERGACVGEFLVAAVVAAGGDEGGGFVEVHPRRAGRARDSPSALYPHAPFQRALRDGGACR